MWLPCTWMLGSGVGDNDWMEQPLAYIMKQKPKLWLYVCKSTAPCIWGKTKAGKVHFKQVLTS